MDEPLDLSITFLPLFDSSLCEAIASIELRCDRLGLQHRGDILIDPLTDKERENLRWYLEEYAEWPYEQFFERGKKVEAFLAELGKRLYQAVCGSTGAMGIVQSWRLQPLQPGTLRQISIISDLPEALSLPWELLHDEQGFLVLRTRNPIALIRRLPQGELSAFSIPFEPPLRILLVTARPDNMKFTDPRGVARELLDEVQPQIDAGMLAVEFLRPPTLRHLRERLSDTTCPPIHILHFDGHGLFSKGTDGLELQHFGSRKQGMLAFEDNEGKLDLVEAERLAQVLQDSGVKLAVLTACQSAVSGSTDAFSSVAAQLIRSGLNAVSAMSASIIPISAARYAEAFYRSLVDKRSVPLAQERARQALHDDPRRDVHHRRKDDEGTIVMLRDWWIPHYYQQRPLLLHSQSTRKRKKVLTRLPSPKLNTGMPLHPRYGFWGRAHELLQIERGLLLRKVVVLHGFGGIGKTALACEAADWLVRTNMYGGACFISFEHGDGSATLLNTLGTSLGIPHESHKNNSTEALLAQLLPALKQKHMLVIADNLGGVHSDENVSLDAAARDQLWDTLLALANNGIGVLLTTRDTTFGDGYLAFGAKAIHIELNGLQPEDAYAFASRLLTDLNIDRSHIPYADICELLYQLCYHPLAIQLVLPALHRRSLSAIRAEFSALLPHLMDDTETSRNHSLLASLDYSLQQLDQEQQLLLERLSIFEGGANENDLLMITQIPTNVWEKLRSALERTGLLAIEPIHIDIRFMFIRFHPILIPFLRNRYNEDLALQDRYVEHYYMLTNSLFDENERYPLPIRTFVKLELPNLMHALMLLLRDNTLAKAAAMMSRVARFLTFLGLIKERDELRQLFGKAVMRRYNLKGKKLTSIEWQHEIGLGEDEYERGHFQIASVSFKALLEQIENGLAKPPLGPGSLEHCLTLIWLARCLYPTGQGEVAKERLHEALAIIDTLNALQPDDQALLSLRGSVLGELGNTFLMLDNHSEAVKAYTQGLNIYRQLGDVRSQAVTLGQLGSFTFYQKEYMRNEETFNALFHFFRELGELSSQAVGLQHLGQIAIRQENWIEAERCYRESLILCEQQENDFLLLLAFRQLANIAKATDRISEAEGWYKKLVDLSGIIQYYSISHVDNLAGLADFQRQEVEAGNLPFTHLNNAFHSAELALHIEENLLSSSEIWRRLHLLADITALSGQAEKSKDLRDREHQAFKAFPENCAIIDKAYELLIPAIVSAAKGSLSAKRIAEETLNRFEEDGWSIIHAIYQVWDGERNWNVLTEKLDGPAALLVQRVLERLALPASTAITELRKKVPEQIIGLWTFDIHEAFESGDIDTLLQTIKRYSPEDQQSIWASIFYLAQQLEELSAHENSLLQDLEPLLQAIASKTRNSREQNEIEAILSDMETKGWHIEKAVKNIWSGERDRNRLIAGLDEEDTTLILRILDIIGGE